MKIKTEVYDQFKREPNNNINEDIYNKMVIEYYGTINQWSKVAEESSELAKAAMEYKSVLESKFVDSDEFDSCRKNIVQEIADVEIMISQARRMLGITDEEINQVKEFKMKRQIERMKADDRDNRNDNQDGKRN